MHSSHTKNSFADGSILFKVCCSFVTFEKGVNSQWNIWLLFSQLKILLNVWKYSYLSHCWCPWIQLISKTFWFNILLTWHIAQCNIRNHISHSDNPLRNLSYITGATLPGVSNLLVPLGHTGRRVVLPHTLYSLWHIITKISHYVLSKLTIFCWATFIAILSLMWPMGRRLDTAA